MIDLQQISFSYPDNSPALSDISLHIDKGQCLALLGPNGSGKSTVLQILNGLLIPQSGRYLLNGQPVSREKLHDKQFSFSFHRQIGYLFQNPEAQLFCSSVREEVAFGPRQLELSAEEQKKRVDDCLELLQIRDIADRVPYHLSGGEKKKVALAAILSLNPDVLTLDEPLNDLSPRSRAFLVQLLLSLKAAGKTIICATHDLSSIAGLFDTVAIFTADHHIARQGNADQVLSDSELLQAADLL